MGAYDAVRLTSAIRRSKSRAAAIGTSYFALLGQWSEPPLGKEWDRHPAYVDDSKARLLLSTLVWVSSLALLH